jgi:hypothetical protein
MLGLPVIDGRQRLKRFLPFFADKKLPPYILQAD